MIPDGYRLLDKISNSDSAQVWTASDSSGETVVLKLAAENSDVKKRFEREINAMIETGGPRVMPILSHDASYSWYVMPRATQTLYATTVPSSVQDCLTVVEAVAEALRPLHRGGQVHRDLKPQNILGSTTRTAHGGSWRTSAS